jgi:predicted peptidase
MTARIISLCFLTAGLGLAEPASEGFLVRKVMVAGKERAFRVLVPRPDPQLLPVPVILFLHGAGERGTDNEAQLRHFPEKLAQPDWRAAYRCFVVAPQCEPEKQWVEAPWGDKQAKAMALEPSEMMQVAMAALQKVRSDHAAEIDPSRIYLTGLSMGGYGAWELAMRHPEWFAALAPICGGGDESNAARLRSLPIWAFHGNQDTIVWPERTERMVAAVIKAGGRAKVSLLPGVGHDAWTPAYDRRSGLMEWLFSQRRAIKQP